MSEGSEKSFAPTEKRLRDAAREGDVLRSRELATAVAVLAGAAWMQFAGPWLMDGLREVTRLGLSWDRTMIEGFAPQRLVAPVLWAVLPPVLSLALLVMVAVLISQLSFASGRFNPGSMLPKASRLDPLAGLKRMFGLQGLIEMGKGLLKVGLLGAIAWWWAADKIGLLRGFEGADLRGQLAMAWSLIVGLVFALAAGLVVIALVDLPVQIIRRNQRLKMSHQDMRDEHKESEGSPEARAHQRQRQRAVAMGSVQNAMGKAQFVLTNPSHFAVAMTWDPDMAPAPVVLAKGRGEKALAMRQLAAEMDVPVLEYPALARSVYFTTRERQMIREELYAAVASVLAFVLALKRGDAPPRPVVEVPLALRFDPEGRPDIMAT